ncbi:hypothetical protein DUK53_16100 [Listeria sp. SHR_NRA_18]|uniref:hypothetical protein n=1 Tax=Listeria sp. SHR_NRA_18 TaxID=2269046 RepID=UPI000F5E876C|nr:hypothetical protein [Listeria sp. SHR_NRA_18]RQW65473.1 hypothetical protein DUK53_16100 [Listeria sp. SHR_NRA_18]
MNFYSENKNQADVKGGDELKNTKMVKFDIQHFAEPATEPTEPNAAGNEPPAEPTTPPTPPTEPPTTFSKEDFLKDLGVDSEDALQQQLKAYKDFQDSQKTEADKQAEALQAAQDEANRISSESAAKDWQIAALKNGVTDDYLSDVIALAEKLEEKDPAKAVKAVLEKYPFFSKEAQPTKNTGNAARQQNYTTTPGEAMKSAFQDIYNLPK